MSLCYNTIGSVLCCAEGELCHLWRFKVTNNAIACWNSCVLYVKIFYLIFCMNLNSTNCLLKDEYCVEVSNWIQIYRKSWPDLCWRVFRAAHLLFSSQIVHRMFCSISKWVVLRPNRCSVGLRAQSRTGIKHKDEEQILSCVVFYYAVVVLLLEYQTSLVFVVGLLWHFSLFPQYCGSRLWYSSERVLFILCDRSTWLWRPYPQLTNCVRAPDGTNEVVSDVS